MLLASACLAPAAFAQHDAILLGLRHGSKPPEWLLQRIERDPRSFEVDRGWKSALAAARLHREVRERPGAAQPGFELRGGIKPGEAVEGTFPLPVLPVLFSNTLAAPVTVAALQERLFGTGAGLSVRGYYAEVSRGLATVTGTVVDWVRAPMPDTYYEGFQNGAPPYLGELLRTVVERADSAIDFRQFDRDADGYVDFVIFVHPEPGGECNTPNIWSHRWVYGGASATGAPLLTEDGVYISDYLIVPALTCPDTEGLTRLIDIGVIAHELGHAFGLPDLYATVPLRMMNAGIAEWGLMGYGNWNSPESPAHMEAWSKAELGWAPVQLIEKDTATVRLEPVETNGVVLRINIPPPEGSSASVSEYFLLENRQRIGSDKHLIGTGLLIWHVDEETLAARWGTNTVMEEAGRKGLDLEEADGNRNLDSPGGQAWPSHPFPGTREVRSFTSFTTPASNPSYLTYRSGISISNIRQAGIDIVLDVSFEPSSTLLRFWGDVNGDGMIGADDAREVSLFVMTGQSESDMSVADVDGSGSVDQRDALIILSYYDAIESFLLTPFRVGTPVSSDPTVRQLKAPVKR